jgi:hypothetical protein
MSNNSFNKKLFALLLDLARGDRSWRQFAQDCDISYVQIRKLATCKQENAPRIKLIKKIATNSQADISVDDFLFVSGSCADSVSSPFSPSSAMVKQGDIFYEKYLSLSMGQRKMINDLIDFLAGRE